MGVNGWSNVAGVIAGHIFKSKYSPRCKFSRRHYALEFFLTHSQTRSP